MAELSDIYNDRILALAATISKGDRLAHPDATATAHSKLCGSTVTVDVSMAEGHVVAFGQTVKACLLGQAAASVMAQQVVGRSATEVREIGQTMRAMLKQGGPPPSGRWADLAVLEPVRAVKGRHASTLLIFDAVEQAIAAIEAKAGEAKAAAS
jgi:NifU-like protein involved in Fe-S cluster formation